MKQYYFVARDDNFTNRALAPLQSLSINVTKANFDLTYNLLLT